MFLPYKNTHFPPLIQYGIHSFHKKERPRVIIEEERVSAKTDLDLSLYCSNYHKHHGVFFLLLVIFTLCDYVVSSKDYGKTQSCVLALGTRSTGKILRLGSVLFLSLKNQGMEKVRLNTNKKWWGQKRSKRPSL